MRILVTGADGFVGGHLLENLTAFGHTVIASSRLGLHAPDLAVEILDVRDPERVREVVSRHRPEGVVHLAAQASVPRSWEDPEETYRTNIIGTSHLLESLKDLPATRVLLVGSAQEYGLGAPDRPLKETDPLVPGSPYAVSKVAQELLGGLCHREWGLPVVSTRTFNHTGPRQSTHYALGAFCAQIVRIERGEQAAEMHVGRLDARRDFLDVRDVVNAYRLLVTSDRAGEVYNVASGQGVSIRELLLILLDVAGLAGMAKLLENPAPRAGDPDALVGDSSKLRADLGWRPEIPLTQSLLDTLEWYRARPTC